MTPLLAAAINWHSFFFLLFALISCVMALAASATVCRPDEQNRFTVIPDAVIGNPARNPIWRAMF